LKAVAAEFSKERLPLVNGAFVACGAAGAVTGTEPAAWLVEWLGWRELFLLLAGATAVVAIGIFVIVAEPAVRRTAVRTQPVDIRAIYRDARFWRLAPVSALCIGSSWALQGLWAALWLADVAELDRTEVVRHLFVMAVALCAGALLIGVCADVVRKYGIGLERVLAAAVCIFVAAEFALVLRLPVPCIALWAVVGAMGAATVLSYGIIGNLFPLESAGRANAALNVLHIGAAFAIQSGMGAVVGCWARDLGGHYPVAAYTTALLGLIALQLAAFVWFLKPLKRSMLPGWLAFPPISRQSAISAASDRG
jgi:predicted MFS family arabinose efflux permease